MAIDHIVLIVIGVLSIIGALFLLAEAKAYRARHQVDEKQPHDTKHA